MEQEKSQAELLIPINLDDVEKYKRRLENPWSFIGLLYRIRRKRRVARMTKFFENLGPQQDTCHALPEYPKSGMASHTEGGEDDEDRIQVKNLIQLKDKIPLEDLPLENDRKAILIFASTFAGYEHFGSFSACADAAQAKRRATIVDLRNELFFAWRAGAHTGNSQSVVSVYSELLPYFRKQLDRSP